MQLLDERETLQRPVENDQTPSIAAVHAVATYTDTAPTDLPPLQNTLDTEALDALFAGDHAGKLTFTYAGCDVTIYDGTTVAVTATAD